MSRKLFAAMIAAMLLPLASQAQSSESQELKPVRTQGMSFTDESGRELILRGVNAGGRSKLPPFFPFEPVPDFETALAQYADQVQALVFKKGGEHLGRVAVSELKQNYKKTLGW